MTNGPSDYPDPSQSPDFYANPAMEKVLRAVPMLQWRRCWDCSYTSLYRDNMIPACNCHECGSSDTRAMRKANKILHGIEDHAD